jgi:hypothetical protein
MQRNDLVALVAGTSVGIVGGAFGVFLACIAGEVAVRRFLVELGDPYIELSQPSLPAAQHVAMALPPARDTLKAMGQTAGGQLTVAATRR